MSEQHSGDNAPHLVRITHDAESHQIEDCHDDCRATVICPGVVDSCRAWWECDVCLAATKDMSDEDADAYDERLWETSEAHGVEHQHIDGMWMTASNDCISAVMDHDANDLVESLPDGDHAVDLECEDGFVMVYQRVIRPARTCAGCGGELRPCPSVMTCDTDGCPGNVAHLFRPGETR